MGFTLSSSLFLSLVMKNPSSIMRILLGRNVLLHLGNQSTFQYYFIFLINISQQNILQTHIQILINQFIILMMIKISHEFIQILQSQRKQREMPKLKQSLLEKFFIMIFLIIYGLPNVLGNNFLFLGMGVQLYIPGQYYSALQVTYSAGSMEKKRFKINVSLTFNQTAENDQSNTVFDLLTCDQSDSASCVSCFLANYNYLNARYAKYEPCMEACTSDVITSHTMQTSYSTTINQSGLYLIDNTFYPCSQGAYQPQLYLQQSINISIQQNSTYGILTKIVFILLLQVMMMTIAYVVIMFRKYRKLKKKLEYIKGQEQAQDLLNSFLVGASK